MAVLAALEELVHAARVVVVLEQGSIVRTARGKRPGCEGLGAIAGQAGRGVWRLPQVGLELAAAFVEGDGVLVRSSVQGIKRRRANITLNTRIWWSDALNGKSLTVKMPTLATVSHTPRKSTNTSWQNARLNPRLIDHPSASWREYILYAKGICSSLPRERRPTLCSIPARARAV
jgi:hypothetical protein